MVSAAVSEAAEHQAGTLADLYERHAPAAVRLAFLITGDRERSRDIAQDAFVRVAARFRHLRFPDLYGFLGTLAVGPVVLQTLIAFPGQDMSEWGRAPTPGTALIWPAPAGSLLWPAQLGLDDAALSMFASRTT